MNLELADYKLTDFLSTAAGTVGLIITAGIILGNLNRKYVAVCGSFRDLAEEYRSDEPSDSRRGNLQVLLSAYRRKFAFLNYATMLVCCTLVTFLLTVWLAGLSIMLPGVVIIRTIGTAGLIVGLALLGAAVALQLADTVIQRRAMGKEIADFQDQLPPISEALQR
jgi:hypothetical protein